MPASPKSPPRHRPLIALATIAVAIASGVSAATAVSPTDNIDTVAGTGAIGFGGDGFGATTPGAKLRYPSGVLALGGGEYLIADRANHRVRHVDASGVIRTIAGGGPTYGDGLATSVRLLNPWGVARGSDGTIYIADRNRHRIAAVDTDGNLTTVAGTNGTAGSTGDGGPATAATLRFPNDVVVDAAGNLYISDRNNHSVRKVDATTKVITTVAGTGALGFSGDGGPATSAQLRYPEDLDVDDSGNIYIADRNNHRIRKVDTSGTIRTIAGGGPVNGQGQATSVRLSLPGGVDWVRGGTVYIADRSYHRIRRVTADGQLTTIAGTGTAGFSGDGAAAGAAELKHPEDVSLDPDGNVFIADRTNHRIRAIANVPPAAVLSAAPTSGAFPLPVAFSAAGSLDSNSQIVSYEWDFGDGGTGTGTTPNHTYTAAGTYPVSLTVTDDSGAQVTATGSIVVAAPTSAPPVAPPATTPPPTPTVPTGGATCHGRPATIVGTASDDVIVGTPNDDVIVAGAGDDTVWGLSGNDVVCLGAGDDRLAAGPGNDIGLGGDGDDRLKGGPGADGLAGGDGIDRLEGHGGGDTLWGGDGGDRLGGGTGGDQIHGGNGADVLFGGPGGDEVYGEGGNDRLHGHDGNDRLQGGDGRDIAHGGDGRDLILGGNGNDTLMGGYRNDRLSGGAGNDALYGQHGRDRLTGSSGRDMANGGRGKDVCRAEVRRSC